MEKLAIKKGGFTIVELLVSVGILVIFIPVVANLLISCQFLASYSKHKTEAAYAAQQIIEQQRQLPFNQIVSLPAAGQPVWQVSLDDKGDFTNDVCAANPKLFCGNVTLTVTSAQYTSIGGGLQAPNNNVKHLVVTITWPEQTVFNMTETYAEDIANDPTLN